MANNLIATKKWIVNLAPDQGYLGRSYITLREHKASLSELSSEEWEEFTNIARQLEVACKSAFSATLFNWTCLLNNAYRDKPFNPHVHWHFRPRYESPVKINELTFLDPEFGYHYDREQRRDVDFKTFQAIFEKLKKELTYK